MPPFNPASKAMVGLGCRRNLFSQRMPSYCNCNQIRRLSSAAGNRVFSSVNKIFGGVCRDYTLLDREDARSRNVSVFQKRGFLGCGNGGEGNMLSRVYEERQIVGYSPEQLFNVVAAVDMYQDFVPWCQRSQIIRRYPDGNFDAELQIGFKFLVESYISHVEIKSPKYIKTTSTQSTLFDHLINVWEFNPGRVPGTCNLYFLVDFKFQSPFYRQVANMFFKEVVSRLVGSFNDRCRLIYGPGVPILENGNEQRAHESSNQ